MRRYTEEAAAAVAAKEAEAAAAAAAAAAEAAAVKAEATAAAGPVKEEEPAAAPSGVAGLKRDRSEADLEVRGTSRSCHFSSCSVMFSNSIKRGVWFIKRITHQKLHESGSPSLEAAGGAAGGAR